MKLLSMLRHFNSGSILVPFKIYCNTGIRILSGGRIVQKSRVTIGNPDSAAAVISRAATNIFVGRNSELSFGTGVSIGPGVSIIVKDKAHLAIGDGTYFTSDSHIEVVKKIAIGERCAISWGVTIIDDDHHVLEGSAPSTGVSIGNKVWVGCNVTILKNTEIGDGCVIAAGSVVRGTFHAGSLIAGNPAKAVRNNISWK